MRRFSSWPAVILVAAILAAAARPSLASHLLVFRAVSAGHLADLDEHAPVIATGDFNHDGIADVVEPSSNPDTGRHSLTVLLGHTDGTFTRVDSHDPIGDDPTALVVGDFNGDGNEDVIVGDGGGSLVEFLGDGRGNLVRSGAIATLGSVASIARGHFTKSGHLDLVVSDVHSDVGVVLLGDGHGGFQATWTFRLPKIGVEYHIATADFNKDGIPDLAVTSDDDEDYEVLLGTGNGTFSFSSEYSRVRDPNSYCPS